MQVPLFADRFYAGRFRKETTAALEAFFSEGQYILGPSLEAFEAAVSRYLDVPHTIGVANGTDALQIALKVIDVGAGDEVIVPAHTFVAVPLAVLHTGATPVFAEVTPEGLPDTHALPFSSRTKAVVAVHLYGRMAEVQELEAQCRKQGCLLIEDFSQAQGASRNGQKAGVAGQINIASLYPTKPLGGLGDGGIITTWDEGLAAFARQYREYGQEEKGVVRHAGINSRLDALQARFLMLRLQHLDAVNTERTRQALHYNEALQGTGDLVLPEPDGLAHVHHLYVVQTTRREALREFLAQQGIRTGIHYPVPAHLQPCFASLGHKKGDFSVAERLADRVLSLPLFYGMTDDEQAHVVQSVRSFYSA